MQVSLGSRSMEMQPAANIDRCTDGRCGGGCEAGDVRFYVSMLDVSGRRTAFVLGPFETHQEALDQVDLGNRMAQEVDARAFWYSCGRVRVQGPPWPTGVLGGK